MNLSDTIAAISTPPGEGGVAVIRISGKTALAVLSQIFSKDLSKTPSHKAVYGAILDSGELVDQALVMPMLEGRSYTGEETVEIFCHGGSLISRKVLETVLKAGARAAFAGEFTYRAFLNGKIDLAQAEAVQTLIHAKNERMLSAASEQLEGRLSRLIGEIQKRLIDISAILEAWVDFPDEGLEFEPMEKVVADLEGQKEALEKLEKTFHEGKILHDGLKVALIGTPNVGKSSLMNALLSKEHAIVSPIAGTTRDRVEGQMILAGLNVLLIDTAGIRTTEELVEIEGIKRSRQAMSEADLVLLVLDASRVLQSDEEKLLESAPREKTLVVWNKMDKKLASLPELDFAHVAHVSALTNEGIEALSTQVELVVWKEGLPSKEEMVVCQARHKEAIVEAKDHLATLVSGLKEGLSPELVASDAKAALHSLGKILGMNVTEDVLSAIFSKFCIGK